MYSIGKRITSGVVAGAVVLGILAVYPTGNKGKVYAASLGDTGYTTNDGYNATYDTVGSVNYNTVLGRATAYGIVADTWEQNNHSETNFAVNKFIHNTTTSGHVLEPDLAGTAPLSFLVGDIEGKLIFGGATYENQNVKYVIHTTQALKDDYDSHQNVTGNSEAYKDAKIAVQDIAGKASLSVDSLYSSDSVSNMISHVRTESDNLATKTSTVDIALYESAHPQDANHYVLDLDVDDYDGKVVYITVPYNSTLGSIFKDSTSHSQALYVRKKANTNVVFNFTDAEWTTVCAKGPLVHITDKAVEYNKVETLELNNEQYIIPKTQYTHNDKNKIVEEEIVDRVIFNFPNSATVNVLEGGGAYLAPRATTSEVISTSSGWFVTGGKFVNNTCEWHFLNGDRASSLFFSGQKKFTESYTNHRAESPEVELYDYSGITYNDGDFKFDLFHSDSNYNLGSIIETVPVSAAGEFTFKPLDGLVPGQTYYYIIKETADTIAGITNSDGEIDIQVDVYDKGQGEVGYRITSRKYLTAADKANGISFRSNDAREAQELDFYFGSVYNLVTPDTGSLTVTKVLSDEKPTTAPIEYTFYVKCGNEYVQDLTTGATAANKHAFTVTAGDTNGTVITGLKLDKTYTVEEADVTGLPAGWSCAATYSKNSVTLSSSNKDNSVVITNTFSYTAPANDAYINITKTFGGDVTAEDLKGLTFELYDSTDTSTPVETFTFKDHFTVTSDSKTYQLTTPYQTSSGKTYYVVETNTAITGYDLVKVTYKVDGDTNATEITNLTTYQSGTVTPSSGNTSTIGFTNEYTKITGKLTVDKELDGVTGNATKEYKFVVIVGNNEGYLQSNGKSGNDPYEFTVQPGSDKSINVDYSVFGKKLTVEEVTTGTEVNISGYDFTGVTYSDNNGVTLSDTSRTATVVVTNKYDQQQTNTDAYINITKTFGGDVTAADYANLTFTIYDGDGNKIGDTIEFNTTNFDKVSTGNYQLKNPIKVEAGKSYYVVESNTAITGYKLVSVSYKLDGDTNPTVITTTTYQSGETSVLTAGDTSTVAFTNTYNKITGKLTVDKDLSGVTGNTTKDYKFVVKVGNNEGYLQANGTLGNTAYEFTVQPGTNKEITVDYSVFGKALTVEEVTTATVVNIDGYDFVSVGYSDNNGVTLSDTSKTATVVVTNTYNQQQTNTDAYINITKTVGGGVTEQDLNNLKFELYDSNDQLIHTFKFSANAADSDFELKSADVYGLKNAYKVTSGTTYYVVEKNAAITGYDLVTVKYKLGSDSEVTLVSAKTTDTEFTSASFTPNDSNNTAADAFTVKFTNIYDQQTNETGSLTVTKVTSDAKPTNAPTEYTFYVKCGSEGYVQDATTGAVAANKHAFTVTAGDTTGTVISGLKLDKTYTVEEADVTGLPTGWSCAASYSKNSVNLSLSHKADSIQITNTFNYTAPVNDAYINITKTVGGGVTEQDLNNLKFELYDSNDQLIHTFKFSANAADSDFELKSADVYGLKNAYKVTSGTTYYVVEKNAAITGYDLVTVKYKLGSDSEVTLVSAKTTDTEFTSASFTPDDSNNTAAKAFPVQFTNIYDQQQTTNTDAYINLTKKVGGGVTEQDLQGLTFELYDSNNQLVQKFTFKDDFEEKSTNVYGLKNAYKAVSGTTYYVVEKNTAITGYDLVTVKYKVGSASEVELVSAVTTDTEFTSASFTPDGSNNTAANAYPVQFTNIYDQQSQPQANGALEINKVLGAGAPTDADNYTYEFTVTGPNYSDTVSITGAGSTTIYNLEPGDYTVTEINGNINGYDLIVTGDNGSAISVAAGETSRCYITNTYSDNSTTVNTNTIVVMKSFDGLTQAQINSLDFSAIEFTITGTDPNNVFTVSYSQFTNGTYTFDNLTDDTYTITESGYSNFGDIEYRSTSVTGGNVSNDTASVTGNSKATFVVVNTYEDTSALNPSVGSLVITKSIDGDIPNGSATKNYSFLVTGPSYPSGKLFTVKGSGNVTIDNLVPGSYDVTETSADIDGYTLSVSGEGTYTVSAGAFTACGITNTYQLKNSNPTPGPNPTTGSITFTKTFGGDVTELEASGCGLYFVITDTNGMFLKLDGTLTSSETRITLADMDHPSADVWSATINSVPFGVYTVTEHNEAIYIGGGSVPYTFESTSVKTDTTTLSDSNLSGRLELTNTYTHPGFDVTISKQDIAGKEIAQAYLKFKSMDGYDLSKVIVTQNGKNVAYTLSENNTAITFVTVEGYPSIIQGLFAGEYELEETVTPEAYLTAEKITFRLNADGTVTDGNGKVSVYGSPIVMIDKADPTYQTGGNNTSVISANRSPIPSTGEGISYYACAGVLILGMCTAGFVGFGVYRKKKKEF